MGFMGSLGYIVKLSEESTGVVNDVATCVVEAVEAV